MKKCPFCAELIQDEAVKCKHCGSLLDQKLAQTEANKVEKKVVVKREGLFLSTLNCGCAMIFLIIGFIVLVAIFSHR